MLREISLRMMLICGIKKKNTAKQNKNKHVDVEKRLVLPERRRSGEKAKWVKAVSFMVMNGN